MKKFLSTLSFVSLVFSGLQAQDSDFDKKFRFGLKASPQPTWLKSKNTSSKGNGNYFGFGFGLCMEFKLSNIVHFVTGIGGDFEGGSVSYRNDTTFQVRVVINNEDEMVENKKNQTRENYDLMNGNSSYILKDRQYRATIVSIPLLLKMMTNEYSGFRYFAMFGGELGVRAGLKANDTYYSGLKAVDNGTVVTQVPITGADLERTGLDVNPDAQVVPLRFGMNLGLGSEYRIAGSTSLVFSVNYFQSFTNLMRKNSDYLTRDANGYYTMTPFTQQYFAHAVRINVGIMF